MSTRQRMSPTTKDLSQLIQTAHNKILLFRDRIKLYLSFVYLKSPLIPYLCLTIRIPLTILFISQYGDCQTNIRSNIFSSIKNYRFNMICICCGLANSEHTMFQAATSVKVTKVNTVPSKCAGEITPSNTPYYTKSSSSCFVPVSQLVSLTQ